jgi:hypothetical protein
MSGKRTVRDEEFAWIPCKVRILELKDHDKVESQVIIEDVFLMSSLGFPPMINILGGDKNGAMIYVRECYKNIFLSI